MKLTDIYIRQDGEEAVLMLPLANGQGYINEKSAYHLKLAPTGISPEALDLIRDQLIVG